MKRKFIILNIAFVILFLICLIFSFYIGFFIFLPIICFLPFAFKREGRNKEKLVDLQPQKVERAESKEEIYPIKEKDIEKTYCPLCGGEIKESIAKYCYHCGSKLKND